MLPSALLFLALRLHSVVHPSGHCLPVPRVPLAGQYPHVRPAERGIAQGVAHRIDRRVDVAQGVHKVPQLLREAFRAAGERLQQHEDVIRSPRDDETEQDGGQCLGRLGLLLLLLRLLLLLDLSGSGQGLHNGLRDDLGVERDANVLCL